MMERTVAACLELWSQTALLGTGDHREGLPAARAAILRRLIAIPIERGGGPGLYARTCFLAR